MEQADKKKNLYSFFTVVAGGVSGIFASPYCPDKLKMVFTYSAFCCILITALIFLLSHIEKKRFEKRIYEASVEENQRFYFSLLQSAETVSAKKLAFIRRIRHLTDAIMVFMGLAAFLTSFTAGVQGGYLAFIYLIVIPFTFTLFGALMVGAFSAVLTLSSILLMFGYGSSFFYFCLYFYVTAAASVPARAFAERMILKKAKQPDNFNSVLPEKEYPCFYGLAKKASEKVGFKGRCQLAVDSGNTVTIFKTNTGCVISISIMFLCQASEEELYNVFLHEFAHWSGENQSNVTETIYDRSLNTPSSFFNMPFLFLDTIYHHHYNQYRCVSSVLREQIADKAIHRYGNASSFASALLKTEYFYYFDWESYNKDIEPDFSAVKPDFRSRQIMKSLSFESAIYERQNDWNKLIEKEISPPGHSHPLLRKRLEALGITEYKIMPKSDSGAYLSETEKAITFLSDILSTNIEGYEEHRNRVYLEPKRRIESWEEEGKPLYEHNYAEVAYCLRLLGRVSEANEVLEQAIEKFDDKETAYAQCLIGFRQLHDYDAAGIETVYRAIELNRKYAAEGLEEIKRFCCLTGNQTELDKCLEKSGTIF